MIRFVAFAALVACTETPADTLSDLQSSASQCGVIEMTCVPETDPATVLACMNTALANGSLFETSWGDYDEKMFVVVTTMFADGGQARVFVSQPDDFGGPETTVTEQSCAGPFALVTETACGNNQVLSAGCP
jgi:hypothetical protein